MLTIPERIRIIESGIEKLMAYLRKCNSNMTGNPDDFLIEWADMKVFISHFTKEIDNSLTPEEKESLKDLIKKAENSLNLPR